MVKVWVHYSSGLHEVETFRSVQEFIDCFYSIEGVDNVCIFGRKNGKESNVFTKKLDSITGNDMWSISSVQKKIDMDIERVDVDGKCYLSRMNGLQIITSEGYEKIIKPFVKKGIEIIEEEKERGC